MKLFRVCVAMLFLLLVSWLGVALDDEVLAQSFSGLNGKELQSRINSEAEMVALLGEPGNKVNMLGNISEVAVKTDSEHHLVLSVSSVQLDQKVLSGKLHGTDGKHQAQILVMPVVIPPGSTPTELTFSLDERLPKETRLESAVLHLFVADSSSTPPSLVRSYIIAKKWQMEILPENMVTFIAPQPIEEATSLTERPIITAVPPKSLTPHAVIKEGVLARPRVVVPNQPMQISPQ